MCSIHRMLAGRKSQTMGVFGFATSNGLRECIHDQFLRVWFYLLQLSVTYSHATPSIDLLFWTPQLRILSFPGQLDTQSCFADSACLLFQLQGTMVQAFMLNFEITHPNPISILTTGFLVVFSSCQSVIPSALSSFHVLPSLELVRIVLLEVKHSVIFTATFIV